MLSQMKVRIPTCLFLLPKEDLVILQGGLWEELFVIQIMLIFGSVHQVLMADVDIKKAKD